MSNYTPNTMLHIQYDIAHLMFTCTPSVILHTQCQLLSVKLKYLTTDQQNFVVCKRSEEQCL